MAKITMKNSEVKALIDCLDKLAVSGVTLSPKMWYHLSRNKSTLNKINEEIEEARVNIVKGYVKGKDSRVPEDKVEEFQTKYNELLVLERDVDIMQLKFSTLEAEMDKLNGVPHIYLFFDHLVEDNEEDKTPEKEDVKEVAA